MCIVVLFVLSLLLWSNTYPFETKPPANSPVPPGVLAVALSEGTIRSENVDLEGVRKGEDVKTEIGSDSDRRASRPDRWFKLKRAAEESPPPWHKLHPHTQPRT